MHGLFQCEKVKVTHAAPQDTRRSSKEAGVDQAVFLVNTIAADHAGRMYQEGRYQRILALEKDEQDSQALAVGFR